MMLSRRRTTTRGPRGRGCRGWRPVLVVGSLALGATAAWAGKLEGTNPADLAARHLKPPQQIAVAVLPFASPAATQVQAPLAQRERQVELPRVGVLLNLQRHGFQVVPQADAISLVPSLTDKALDMEGEDKLAGDLSKTEAVEAGKKLGADWVVYGNSHLEMDYKAKAFGVRKLVRVALRVNVVEVATGEMLWWGRYEAQVQGSSASHGVGFTAEDAQKGRQLLLDMIGQAFAEIGKALPEHETGPAVTRERLDEILGEMGL